MSNWGLALAGGGTRGAYHLGVWKGIEEQGIKIGGITGTSIGSVNGALFAQGDFEKAVNIWQNIELSNVLDLSNNLINTKNLLDYKNIVPVIREMINKNGLETMPFQQLLEASINEEKLRKSDIIYGLNTTSVSDIESVELFLDEIPQGKLIDTIMASSCFPGFQRIYIEDKAYADGGIINNLPLDMLFKRGFKNIIAVDVGGVGIVKNPASLGANIINIKCKKPCIGMFEFEKEAINKSIKQGYYDTYKAFGRLVGDRYYFNTLDYFRAKEKYSEEIILGLEFAAEIMEIEQIAVYHIDDLINGVIAKYESLKKTKKEPEGSIESILKLKTDNLSLLLKLIQMILKDKYEGLSNKVITNILGNRLTAANAVAFFLKNKNISA